MRETRKEASPPEFLIVRLHGSEYLDATQITLEIPEELAEPPFGDPRRIALEALAARAYEKGVFSEEQCRRMLGLETCWEAREILSKYGVWPGTTVEDVLRDAETAASFRKPVP